MTNNLNIEELKKAHETLNSKEKELIQKRKDEKKALSNSIIQGVGLQDMKIGI